MKPRFLLPKGVVSRWWEMAQRAHFPPATCPERAQRGGIPPQSTDIVRGRSLTCGFRLLNPLRHKAQHEGRTYRKLFELSSEGILVIDRDEIITMINPAMAHKLGADSASLRGRHISSLVPESSHAALRSHLNRKHNSPADSVHVELRKSDGGLLAAKLHASVLFADNHGPRATFISVSDVSEAKRERDEILDVLGRATAASGAKSRFLATVSHEIRSPLNAIIGMTDLVLMTENLSENNKIALNHAKTSAKRLHRIINDLLDISKIEAGQLEIIAEETDLRVLCNEIFASFQPAMQEKALHFELKIDDAIPPIVIGDSLRIYQVICNLLSNALKFTEQGAISLKLSQRDKNSGLVEFVVTDTGKGIPADKLDAIFEEYRQVSKEATCRCQGVGLGLAISRGLVEEMGGSLTVRSEVGRGSSFHFSLPLKPPSAKP